MEEQQGGPVTLTIPCVAEYVGTARLTILGVAGRMGFSYDQIEDIRLAVGEACANAIERSRTVKPANGALPLVTVRCLADASKLVIEVEDAGPSEKPEPVDLDRPAHAVSDMDSAELGALLMEILVDEVAVESAPNGGTMVRLTKHVESR